MYAMSQGSQQDSELTDCLPGTKRKPDGLQLSSRAKSPQLVQSSSERLCHESFHSFADKRQLPVATTICQVKAANCFVPPSVLVEGHDS